MDERREARGREILTPERAERERKRHTHTPHTTTPQPGTQRRE